ncbi:MAG TPA: DUF2569 family protein [Pyrinomonadaceae bacterium]|nr:DUF2569 family protein [Pyrinomonadaceae bacterium]
MDTEIKTESSTLAPQDINPHEVVSPAAPKIGGFLIVVGVGLVLSFLQNLGGLGWSLVPLRGETWESYTTPGFTSYHPYWKPVLLFGVISTAVFLVLNVVVLVLFFRKHRLFPTFMVVLIPVCFVFMLAGYYLEGLVPAIAATQAYAKQSNSLIVKFIAMHLWIPYFVVSDRVKRTFIR